VTMLVSYSRLCFKGFLWRGVFLDKRGHHTVSEGSNQTTNQGEN